MVTFLKSIDSKTWKTVLKGRDHSLVKDGKDTTELKPEEEWSKEEDELILGNTKALNTLFNEVDKNMLRLINNCTWPRMHETYLELHMKVHPRLGCQNCSCSPQNLKILR